MFFIIFTILFVNNLHNKTMVFYGLAISFKRKISTKSLVLAYEVMWITNLILLDI